MKQVLEILLLVSNATHVFRVSESFDDNDRFLQRLVEIPESHCISPFDVFNDLYSRKRTFLSQYYISSFMTPDLFFTSVNRNHRNSLFNAFMMQLSDNYMTCGVVNSANSSLKSLCFSFNEWKFSILLVC